MKKKEALRNHHHNTAVHGESSLTLGKRNDIRRESRVMSCTDRKKKKKKKKKKRVACCSKEEGRRDAGRRRRRN
jgi:hypothetical protein